jgi:hypothetical protein
LQNHRIVVALAANYGGPRRIDSAEHSGIAKRWQVFPTLRNDDRVAQALKLLFGEARRWACALR